MIEYGLACVLTLLVATPQARPYAAVILWGWLAGFAGVQWWPLVSLVISIATLWLCINRPFHGGATVALLAFMMLSADVIYALGLSLGLDWGHTYETALNLGLVAQLVLIGHEGVIDGGARIRDWLCDRLLGRGVVPQART